MTGNRDTPAMRQYLAFKAKHPACVLFFRMGDFYEMFDDDAVTAHKTLGISLTERSKGIPMAGVPFHSADTYLRRMIEAGHRVAVCDQIQDPKQAKGIVERAVTRILTPGTLVDESLLADDTPNTLACIAPAPATATSNGSPQSDAQWAIALVELSTGAFSIALAPQREVIDELTRARACEILYPQPDDSAAEPPEVAHIRESLDIQTTPRPDWQFRPAESLEALLEQFSVASLAGFGLQDDHPALPAAGAIIRYLRETQAIDNARPTSEGLRSGTTAALSLRARSLAHLAPPRLLDRTKQMRIDAVSLRALEIERTMRSGATDGSLVSVFKSCRTPMGRRLLREWLCAPLADKAEIESRHKRVATLISDRRLADELDDQLANVQDVSRIAARIALARATPRDIVALGRSLAPIDALINLLDASPAFAPLRTRLTSARDTVAPLAQRIEHTCVDSPPAHLRDGGLIKSGIDPELDEARALQSASNSWLAEYQAQLIEEHDLPSLKVGYNKVHGYFIELPAAQALRAPVLFTRKQTLKNAERYITPELKDYENKVLSAADRAVQREHELFADLCAEASSTTNTLSQYAAAVAELDVLACFALKATSAAWIQPTITDDRALNITQGRHPVLESILHDRFVPNDLALGIDPETNKPAAKLALITGPNMAGKSTFIRQTALLVILAHAGSFVPAESATIALTDRVFTRIGADDALHQGQSTFMVEMVETANILHNATPRSLVVLDEVGRGTSTLDGLSLAWAIAEHLADQSGPAPRTLFATHYHELTDLADRAPSDVANLHVAVREWGDQIVFLHNIRPGRTNRSYGIHVARLAGMPQQTIQRANELLESLAVSHEGAHRDTASIPDRTEQSADQLPLFTEYLPHPVVQQLKEVKIESLTPLEAFDTLRKLRDSIDEAAQ